MPAAGRGREGVGVGIAADSLEIVRRTVLDALRGQPARVVLFGSRAAGTADRRSDIDVGVLPGAGFERGLLSALRERLAELDIPYTVDLVDLSETSADLRERALAGGVAWRS